ncbi:MAG: hypothetical protein WC617_15935, partial [Rhodanobacter sp.]
PKGGASGPSFGSQFGDQLPHRITGSGKTPETQLDRITWDLTPSHHGDEAMSSNPLCCRFAIPFPLSNPWRRQPYCEMEVACWVLP